MMSQLADLLMRRLEEKGIEPVLVPGFIKNLSNILGASRKMRLKEINRKLHSLGWDFILDDHSLQLFIASLEAGDSYVRRNNKATKRHHRYRT